MKPEINRCTHLKYWARHQRKILSISRLFINNIRDVGSTANFADSADSTDVADFLTLSQHPPLSV